MDLAVSLLRVYLPRRQLMTGAAETQNVSSSNLILHLICVQNSLYYEYLCLNCHIPHTGSRIIVPDKKRDNLKAFFFFSESPM